MTLYIIRNEEVKANCIQEIESLYGEWRVKICKPKRSSNQNAYFHKLVDIVADFVGEDAEDTKWRIKHAMGMYKDVLDNFGNYKQRMLSTAELDKKQFSVLIEEVLILGHKLGLTMPLASHFGLEEK